MGDAPLVVLNVAVFLTMAVTFNSVLGFNIAQLAVWGGNSGLLDLSGQWWRLVTYQFLHMNLWHIAINMWVL
jgi:rhomboid protease GluP